MNTTPTEQVEVAAGVLVDTDGNILLARRPDDAHQGGLWEFPGGKAGVQEAGMAALRRELDEELGIDVVGARPLIRVRHDYGDRRVLLDTWLVESWRGEPVGRQGQPLEWVSPAELSERDLPAADRPIVNAIHLPPLCLVTPEPGNDRDAFLGRLEAALDAGLALVILRAPGLVAQDYLELLTAARERCTARGATLIANPPPSVDADAVLAAGVDGLHLSSARLRDTGERPLPRERWLSASCHDAEELALAERAGCDFALLSPVCTTTTHPDSTPLGWPRFSELVETVNLPVYALGGLGRHDCTVAWQAGAQGVAAMRGLWPEVE